jgi:Mrp family chromosome partitioning ATPase
VRLRRRLEAADQPAPLGLRTRFLAEVHQVLALRRSVALRRQSVFVASTAGPPRTVEDDVGREAVIGLLAGALVGLLLALLAGKLLGRAGSPTEVASKLGTPLIGVLPGEGASEEPVRLVQSRRSGDALREPRSRLVLSGLPPSPVVAMVGAERGAAAPVTVLALAFSLAERGRRVAVVDFDAKGPSLHRLMAVDRGPGMAEVLAGQLRLDEAFIAFDRSGRRVHDPDQELGGLVRMLPLGGSFESDWQLVSAPAVEDLFARLRTDSDVVLVACAPLGGNGAPAPALAGVADGVLVVADLSTLRRRRLPGLRAAIEELPLRTRGAIVIERPRRHAPWRARPAAVPPLPLRRTA